MLKLKEYQQIINSFIHDDLLQYYFNNLREQTTTALSNGKRLRSLLTLFIGENSLHITSSARSFCLFVEYIHNASLIMDDLPSMDNDSERRGKPTIHVLYGQHVAQLLSYNLMIVALKHFNDGMHELSKLYSAELNDKIYSTITNEVHLQLHELGVGQLLDLTVVDVSSMSAREQQDRILKIITYKTASLFSLSLILGWVASTRDPLFKYIKLIQSAGISFGICYQIIDDLKDKDLDLKKNKAINNICRYYSESELIELFTMHYDNFVALTVQFEIYSGIIKSLSKYLLDSFSAFFK